VADGELYAWAREAADALGLPGAATWAASPEAVQQVLDLTRDVAHAVNRPAAPVTSFLAGIALGLAGADDPQQLADACRRISTALSPAEPPPPRPPTPAEVIRDYIAAMESGDRERGYGYYADDLVLRIPGRSRDAGEFHGKQAFIAYIEAAFAEIEDYSFEHVDTLASDERVALVMRERLRVRGSDLDAGRVNVYRIAAGKIAEVSIYEANQYEVDAAFPPPA
jgi:ketosteroid isomerase-like protein